VRFRGPYELLLTEREWDALYVRTPDNRTVLEITNVDRDSGSITVTSTPQQAASKPMIG
jgi:hypothetical protein